jgi:hypothetical protein
MNGSRKNPDSLTRSTKGGRLQGIVQGNLSEIVPERPLRKRRPGVTDRLFPDIFRRPEARRRGGPPAGIRRTGNDTHINNSAQSGSPRKHSGCFRACLRRSRECPIFAAPAGFPGDSREPGAGAALAFGNAPDDSNNPLLGIVTYRIGDAGHERRRSSG